MIARNVVALGLSSALAFGGVSYGVGTAIAEPVDISNDAQIAQAAETDIGCSLEDIWAVYDNTELEDGAVLAPNPTSTDSATADNKAKTSKKAAKAKKAKKAKKAAKAKKTKKTVKKSARKASKKSSKKAPKRA